MRGLVGWGQAATGDFNGDGFMDLAIGTPGKAPGNDPQSEAVFLFLRSNAGITSGRTITTVDAGARNDRNDQFGAALAAHHIATLIFAEAESGVLRTVGSTTP